MDGWMVGWKDGWVVGWMDGWMDGLMMDGWTGRWVVGVGSQEEKVEDGKGLQGGGLNGGWRRLYP